MLKVLSSSVLFGRNLRALPSRIPTNGELRYPLHRLFDSLKSANDRSPARFGKAWFCSDSGDGADKVIEVKAAEEAEAAEGGAGTEEGDSKSSSAIVLSNPRPEDHLIVSFVKKIAFWKYFG